MKKTVTHPRLGEVALYQTRHSKRLSVTVNRHGAVRLSFPLGCSAKAALEFMDGHVEKIEAMRRRMIEKTESERSIIEPPYSTPSHTLEFADAPDGKISGRITSGRVIIKVPPPVPHDDEALQAFVRKTLARALCVEGKRMFPRIVEELARKHGFSYRSVRVRATTSRWGSCSARDDISLSAYLVRLPHRLIEFIVLHELCHTRHKNHSAAFHQLLDSLTDGREKELCRELKQYRPGF